MGRSWQEAGVPVALAGADEHFTVQPPGMAESELDMVERLIGESGAPEQALAEAAQGLTRRRAHLGEGKRGYPAPGSRPRWPTGLRYRPYRPSRRLRDGELLPAGLRVVACPGHTPGTIVLVDDNEGWLFSGDQLLPGITATPGLQLDPAGRGRFRSLPPFLASLKLLAGEDFVRCFPGHGEPFDHVTAAIAENVAVIEERTARVHAALGEGGPATIYALAERMYPRAVQRRFWQVIPTIVGHLDLLEEREAVRNEENLWTAI
jgi:glyoxylase-like metal-dependent hydrolase (beta-lactamase superfamily II)